MSDIHKYLADYEAYKNGCATAAQEMLADRYFPRPHSEVNDVQRHRFQLLYSVLQSFISTNTYRGRTFTFDQILRINSKIFFRFEHHDLPYIATVSSINGYDSDWINIKLNNNGFTYIPRKGQLVPRRQNSDGWILMEAWTQELPMLVSQLAGVANGAFSSARAFYNWKHNRPDIKFYGKPDSGVPNVLITFEDGDPYYDEDVPATPI